RGFNEVARRIHLEQPHALAADLPAEDQRHVELDTGVFQRLRVPLIDMPHRVAQHPCGVEHAPGVPDGDGLALGALLDLLDLQDLAHRLRDAQVARRQQHHEAVTGTLVDDHLAEGADVVHAGVGARIGQEHQPGVEFDADAVGHDLLASFFSWYTASRASRGLSASGFKAATAASTALGAAASAAGGAANKSTCSRLSVCWVSRAASACLAWFTTTAGIPASRATWMP